MIDAKTLSLDEFIKILFSNKSNELQPNSYFPTSKMTNEFIEKVHSFDEKQIKFILRKFLIPNCTLNKDIYEIPIVEYELNRKKNIKKLLSIQYYRKIINLIKDNNYLVWEGLTWILDLLPNSPKKALEVLDAYISANCQFMPDGLLHSLADCSIIIRSRYINYNHPVELFYDLTPKDFELLVAYLYKEMGYEIKLTQETHDGGIDVYATKKELSEKQKLIIQCKRKTKKNVGIEEIRSLLGVLSDSKHTKGILATSKFFTSQAKKFADKNPSIELINGRDLVKLMNINFGPYWTTKIDRIIKKETLILKPFFE